MHAELGPITFHPKRGLRRLNIRVLPFKGVLISFPPHTRAKALQHFVEERQEWILAALERSQRTERKSIEFWRQTASVPERDIREHLSHRIQRLAEAHGFSFNRLSFRTQKSRWGSCSHHNNISLNKLIYFLPSHLQDYILIHELAHTREKNHSGKFWQILFQILGEQHTRECRSELKNYEHLFYKPV